MLNQSNIFENNFQNGASNHQKFRSLVKLHLSSLFVFKHGKSIKLGINTILILKFRLVDHPGITKIINKYLGRQVAVDLLLLGISCVQTVITDTYNTPSSPCICLFTGDICFVPLIPVVACYVLIHLAHLFVYKAQKTVL